MYEPPIALMALISALAAGAREDFTIDNERDEASACGTCGRRLYVRQVTQIFEVRE